MGFTFFLQEIQFLVGFTFIFIRKDWALDFPNIIGPSLFFFRELLWHNLSTCIMPWKNKILIRLKLMFRASNYLTISKKIAYIVIWLELELTKWTINLGILSLDCSENRTGLSVQLILPRVGYEVLFIFCSLLTRSEQFKILIMEKGTEK